MGEVIKYFEDCLAEGRGTAAVDQMFQRAISFTLQAEQEKLDNALQILDDGRLRLLKSSSGRKIYVASGSHREQYICMLSHYCGCESYHQMARKTSEPTMCKHLLALRLSPILSSAQNTVISNHELGSLLER